MVARKRNTKPKPIDRDKERAQRQRFDDPRGPTVERIAQARSNHTVGNDRRGVETWTMQDSPLDRLKKQAKVPSLQYEALNKFRLHWYHGQLGGVVSSMDLNRVFASDITHMDGLPKGERQVFHREQYAGARAALKKIKSTIPKMDDDTFSHKCQIVVDNVLLSEQSLEIAGYAVGARSPYRARASAKNYLTAAADHLIDHWGLAGKRR